MQKNRCQLFAIYPSGKPNFWILPFPLHIPKFQNLKICLYRHDKKLHKYVLWLKILRLKSFLVCTICPMFYLILPIWINIGIMVEFVSKCVVRLFFSMTMWYAFGQTKDEKCGSRIWLIQFKRNHVEFTYINSHLEREPTRFVLLLVCSQKTCVVHLRRLIYSN